MHAMADLGRRGRAVGRGRHPTRPRSAGPGLAPARRPAHQGPDLRPRPRPAGVHGARTWPPTCAACPSDREPGRGSGLWLSLITRRRRCGASATCSPSSSTTPLLLNDSLYYSIQAGRNSEGDWFREGLTEPARRRARPADVALPDAVEPRRRRQRRAGSASPHAARHRHRRRDRARSGGAWPGPGSGCVAAAIAAVYPNLWINDSLVMSETLAVLLVAAGPARRARLRPPAGAVAGGRRSACSSAWARLTRSELALLARRLRRAGVVAGGGHAAAGRCCRCSCWSAALLTVAPWVALQPRRFERPVLLSTNDGTTLLGANCDRDVLARRRRVGHPLPRRRCRTTTRSTPRCARPRAGTSPSTTSRDHLGAGARRRRRPRRAASSTSTGCGSLVALDVGEEKAEWAVWAGIVCWWLLAVAAVVGWRRARAPATAPAARRGGGCAVPVGRGARDDDRCSTAPTASGRRPSRRSSSSPPSASSPSWRGIGSAPLPSASARLRTRRDGHSTVTDARRQARRPARRAARRSERVVVAFSGGADSAFLAAVAHRTLGRRRGPRRHRRVAVARRRRARRLRGAGRGVGAALDAGRDRRDGAGRLPRQRPRPLLPLQGRADGRRRRRSPPAEGATVVLGVNVDDLGDHRPGPAGGGRGRAPRSRSSPPGSPRPTSRAASRALGLRTWDKPAAACLASRVPYGTEVTVAVLSRVERAEAALRALGFAPGARPPLRRHGPHRGRASPTSTAVVARREAVVAARAGRRLPLRDARPRGLPVRQPQCLRPSERGSRVGAMKLAMASTTRATSTPTSPASRSSRRPASTSCGCPRRTRYDAISQVGYLAAKTERDRDRHRDHQRVLAHRHGDRPDRRRLRLRQRRPLHPRPRCVRPAGHRGLPRRARTSSRCRASASTSTCAGWCGSASRSSTTARPCRSRCPPGQGTGLGKPLKLINHPKRADIPVFWASLMGKSVAETAQLADGWLPIFFDPEKFQQVWGDDLAGRAWPSATRRSGRCRSRPAAWSPSATSTPATAPTASLDMARPSVALYVGGMGARDKNFYNTIAKKYGYVDEATEIQDLYLSGARRRRRRRCRASCSRTRTSSARSRLRRRAHRRLQGGRRHAPVGQPGRHRPGQDRRDPPQPARLTSRPIA